MIALVAAGVVAGGTWGLLAPRDVHPHAAGSSALATVALPDGLLRVDGLVDKQVGHVMPGMSEAEDVPEGMRRFAVEVTLAATEDRPLPYARDDFTVSGPGAEPVTAVTGQFDAGVLTAGRSLTGSLSFDVPEDASALTLRYRDADPVSLPALPGVASSPHGHPGDPAGEQGTGEQGAGDEPAEGAPRGGDHPHPAGGPTDHGH